MNFSIFIPLNPPGLNETYQISSATGKAHMFKSSEANLWAAQAALLIGAKAGELDWKDDSQFYEVFIKFTNLRQDADAPVKLVIDTLSRKLGFNDKRIMKQCSEKIEGEMKGVHIELKPYPSF